jgi:Secretion system C-terminal sorting domain
MKKIYTSVLTFSVITLFSISTSLAQVATLYNFTQTSGSFTGLVGATQLGSTTNDDNTFGPFAIGFTFNYNGANYTQFSVNTNGYIVMGTSVGSSTAVLSDATSNTGGNINNAIAAVSEDLIAQSNSMLWYQLQGSGVNHTLVVEWKNYNMYNAPSLAPGTGNALNFQIQLSQTSNKIEIIYGTMAADTLPYYNPEIGLRGNSASDFNNRKIGLSNIWASSSAGTLNTDVCQLSHLLYPTTGQTYRWTRTTVGVENTPAEPISYFDMYPNPSNGTLKISVPVIHFDNCTINIYDMEGKSVYYSKDTNIIGNYSKEISTQGIAKGIYYIKLDTGFGVDVKKLVIQ